MGEKRRRRVKLLMLLEWEMKTIAFSKCNFHTHTQHARIFNYGNTINVSIVLIMDDVIILVFVISCNHVLNHDKI